MSERLDHEEDLPSVTLKMRDGEHFVATPENSSVYMYLDRFACYSHLFLETGRKDDGRLIGSYMFSSHSLFPQIAQIMIDHGFPLHANLRELIDCDRDAFDSMIATSTADMDEGLEGLLGGDGTTA